MINPWALYQRQPAFVLGFHGTDGSIVTRTTAGRIRHLAKSEGTTEWLGHGVYFWENDPERALDWARNGKTKGKIKTPDAVGAVIDLGFCLDLTTMSGLSEVKAAYEMLRIVCRDAGVALPTNAVGPDRVKRELDCAVIQALHQYRRAQGLKPTTPCVRRFPRTSICSTIPDFGPAITSRSAWSGPRSASRAISGRSSSAKRAVEPHAPLAKPANGRNPRKLTRSTKNGCYAADDPSGALTP